MTNAMWFLVKVLAGTLLWVALVPLGQVENALGKALL
jgi:hypothetical protein